VFTATVLTSENIAAGSLVNLYDNTGTMNCRKANATTAGLQADGFVIATTTSGQNAIVYFPGSVISGLSGLVAGGKYVLSTTAGGLLAIASAPSASGNVYQPVGTALTTSSLLFNPEQPIVYA
jgi:hypothetical protein